MKTNNNTTDSTLINSAVILLAILLVMLSFQVKAQVVQMGCTDPIAYNYNPSLVIADNGSCIYTEASFNNAQGFNSTAMIQLKSPTANVFVFDKLVLKYKIAGTNGWTNIVFPVTALPYDSLYGGYIDTLGVSLWFFRNYFQNSFGQMTDDGYRFTFTVRINNLDPLTTYKTRILLKGNNVFTGENKTNTLTNEITTWNNSLEAPFPLYLNNLPLPPFSNTQARVSSDVNTSDARELVSIHNLSGQLVGDDATGVLIYTYTDGTTKKVLR
jgi:hypothetical protein